MDKLLCTALTLACSLVVAASATAQTLPFQEGFDADAADWADNIGLPLLWEQSDGPDGSAFAYTTFDFTGFVEPFPGTDAGPIVHRAEDQLGTNGSSDGNFEGNWNTAGVTHLYAWVRHDSPVELTYIVRVANTFNFPAIAFPPIGDPLVPANEWTLLVFDVRADNPECILESSNPSFTCEAGLANVAHVQLGSNAPQPLITGEVVVTFDVDRVTIVPEPGFAAMLVVGAGAIAAWGRRRSRAWR